MSNKRVRTPSAKHVEANEYNNDDEEEDISDGSFLEERSKFQWLPACCICNEMRISDDVDVKSESTVPKRGHIFERYPKQHVCNRCRIEKISVKTKGSSGTHAYSTDANMDPGEVPLVLARLSRVEVLAISRIHMLSQVIQLRFGVYGYRGNSVYLMNIFVWCIKCYDGILFPNVWRVAFVPIIHLCTGSCFTDAPIYVI
jgi:hypothetical protein